MAAACLLTAVPSMARAATNYMGTISVDTHWTKANSPYVLTGDVTVAPQASLTIDPGVTVQVAATDGMGSGVNTSKVEVLVQGALIANGTAASPIQIVGVTSGPDSWYGITFDPAAKTSSITFTTISDTTYALYVRSQNPVTLSDLAVSNSATGLLWRTATAAQIQRSTFSFFSGIGLDFGDGSTAATVTISDTMVRNSTSSGIQLASGISATIKRSQFFYNGTGLTAKSGSALTFQNNVVALNAQEGLNLTQAGTNAFSIFNSTVDFNSSYPLDITSSRSSGTGVHIPVVTSASSFVLRNNIITNHTTAGVKVDGSTQPSLDHNDVWHNGSNYVGTVSGVGAISTNPLFTQQPTPNWTSVSQAVSGYWSSSTTTPVVVQKPNALLMRLRFNSVSTTYTGCSWNALNFYDVTTSPFDSACTSTTSYTTSAGIGSTVKMTGYVYSSSYSISYSITGYDYVPDYSFNYRLQAASPVIDQGNDTDAPTEDFDQVPRPYDGNTDGTAATDMGAFEYHQNVAPYANAGADQIVLPNTTVSFTSSGSRDPDGKIVSYDWDFGDGSTHGTGPTATHSYATTGTYTVTLKVTDDQGATGTDTAVITVASNLPPVANAGPNQFVDVFQTVTLDASASTDPDGTVVGYTWNFGDGSPTGSGRQVTHSYAKAGVFTATVTVTDNRGATASASTSVVVGSTTSNQPPTAVAGGPYQIKVGAVLTVDGTGSKDPDGTLALYSWSFGDGTTATGSSSTHTYPAPGTYLLKLTVTDNGGATATDSTLVTVTGTANAPPVAKAGGNQSALTGQSVSFDGRGSTDSDGTIASYDWDFGDGSTHGTGSTTTHTYSAAGTYLVKLMVTDDKGATGNDAAIVTVSGPTTPTNVLPVANAGGNKATQVGVSITLDGSGSKDSDGSIASYDWDFGDGTAHGTTVKPTHTYAAAGAYLVKLMVTDNSGGTGTDVMVVTVSNPANQLPIGSAGGNKSGAVGTALTFDGSGSRDPDGTIVSYEWDFGDGTTHGTTATVSHTFAAAGSYLVKLLVTDNQGGIGSDVALVSIGGGGSTSDVPPVANAGSAQTGSVGVAIAFDGTGSKDPDGTITAYDWDFGDGMAHSSEAKPTHAYAKAGTYLVQLTVTDNSGLTNKAVALVTVNSESGDAGTTTDAGATTPGGKGPVADAGGNQTGTVDEALTFDASKSSDENGTIVSYKWDFGDGTTGKGVKVTHAYTKAGVYLVRLGVTDDNGATGEQVALVTIGSGDAADGGPLPDGGTVGDESSGGCHCSTTGGSSSLGSSALALTGLALLAIRRRRR